MGKVGVIKTCPLSYYEGEPTKCMDDCEWNDGNEGCAVWRIVKTLEGIHFNIERLGPMLGEVLERR